MHMVLKKSSISISLVVLTLAISTLGHPLFALMFHQRLINIHWVTHFSEVVTRYFTKLKKNCSVHHSVCWIFITIFQGFKRLKEHK